MRRSIIDIAGYDEQSPRVAATVDDARGYARLIDSLVHARKIRGLSQTDIAERMKTKQSAISDLERTGSNPRIRTLLRYARAVGVQLRLIVVASNRSDFAEIGRSETRDEPIVAPVGEISVRPFAA